MSDPITVLQALQGILEQLQKICECLERIEKQDSKK